METKEKEGLRSSVETVLQIVSAKWTVPILNHLFVGTRRPAELAKLLPGINPKILTERLRDLERWGLIDRKEYKEIPPRVEYSLTLRGRELLEAISPIRDLSERWKNLAGPGFSESRHLSSHVDHADMGGSDESGFQSGNGEAQIKTAKVYLVGLGPGVGDLITLRAVKTLSQADLVMYSASRHQEIAFDHCAPDAELINVDTFTLEEQSEHYLYIKEKSLIAVRLYSGDPAIFGSINEQVDILNKLDIDYAVIPAVPSFTAAAASIGCSLTQVPLCESVILTNLPARAKSPRPGQPKKDDLEKLERLAMHNTGMCIYLYGSQIEDAITALSKHYPPNTPLAVVSAPMRLDERKYLGTLAAAAKDINMQDWDWHGSAVMIVGSVLEPVAKSVS